MEQADEEGLGLEDEGEEKAEPELQEEKQSAASSSSSLAALSISSSSRALFWGFMVSEMLPLLAMEGRPRGTSKWFAAEVAKLAAELFEANEEESEGGEAVELWPPEESLLLLFLALKVCEKSGF